MLQGLGYIYSLNEIVGPCDRFFNCIQDGQTIGLCVIQFGPLVASFDFGWSFLHPSVIEKPDAGIPHQVVVKYDIAGDKLQVDEVVCSRASVVTDSMELLCHLMVKGHERNGLGLGESQGRKELRDLGEETPLAFVGITHFIRAYLKRNRDPGLRNLRVVGSSPIISTILIHR